MTMDDVLADAIRSLVMDLPGDLVPVLAQAVRDASVLAWPQRKTRVLAAAPQPALRARLVDFLQAWESFAPDVHAEAVALALQAAGSALRAERAACRTELVWTGPDSRVIPLRRTDQVLLQLIEGAHTSLHIVSFAVYRIEAITRALVRAAQRGAAISLYIETPDASEGRLAFDTLASFGPAVRQRAAIYTWPLEKRPRTSDGRHGSLHAKVAVADGRVMLVSSANLTEYAMTLNMEMGVLVAGGELPRRLAEQLTRLVEQGVFQAIVA